MGKKIDLTRRKFGRLTVLKENGIKRGHIAWLCLCDCGNTKTIVSYSLRNGSTKSCGCIPKETPVSFGMRGTSTFNSWAGMVQRCSNPNDKSYQRYGGRGITVCKRWYKFKIFYENMGKCPKNFSIERIDNNKGYSPDNYKWATATEQQRNRRPNKRNITGVNGVILNIKTGRYKVFITANYRCYNLGLFSSIEDAIEARKQGEKKYWGKEIQMEKL